ncbi:MAG: permease [Coxiella sp. DG_40]|nr:MAG: permease [Coxiella sp. DG_40]
MFQIFAKWLRCYFSDIEAVSLSIIIILVILMFLLMGRIMIPIIASMIIAYMLTGLVEQLQRWRFPHLLAVILVFSLFIGTLLILFIWLLPLLLQQLINLFTEIPHMLNRVQDFVASLQINHPEFFSTDLIKRVTTELSQYVTKFGQFILSFFIATVSNVMTFVVYLVIVPLLVFFFLKDTKQICDWFIRFLPEKRQVMNQIWLEVDRKIGDFIRGKLLEIMVVTLISFAAFALLGINYFVLLAVGVGISVIIPYVGAILITFPVVIIAYLQWGWSAHFAYLLITYTIIIALDANLLTPLIFSEKMRLHPVAIILAILIFGALWGIWGVFFAIPLATLVDVLLKRWPRKIKEE